MVVYIYIYIQPGLLVPSNTTRCNCLIHSSGVSACLLFIFNFACSPFFCSHGNMSSVAYMRRRAACPSGGVGGDIGVVGVVGAVGAVVGRAQGVVVVGVEG